MMFRLAILLALATAPISSALNVGAKHPRISVPTRIPSRQQAVAVPLDIPSTAVEVETRTKLDPADAWIATLDYGAFRKDVADLGKELLKETGDADVEHLNKIVEWRNIAAIVGLSSIWMGPNPITVAALSTWTYASWTMIAHHTCHGGYNRVDAGRYNSRGFALGFVNRFVDWLDWMQPEAWNIEHNRLHHYRLNEAKDPDLVQRNTEFLHDKGVPMAARYGVVAFFLPVWKWYYYAPNTYKELKINEWAQEGRELPKDLDTEEACTLLSLFTPEKEALRQVVNPLEFFSTVMAPMFFGRFVAIPALLCAIPGVGPSLAAHALVNLILAEFLTNIHSFTTIVTNHAGEDLHTFDDAVKPKTGSFYVRQIIGSTNYATGTDPIDFAHGWLNYQIEHHVWPDLSMLQYQRGAPKLKAICEKHGVPYVQENVFERTRKTIDIMVGKTKMRKFPTEYEPAKDKAGVAGVTWKSTNGAIDE